MYARVARWEGVKPDAMRRMAQELTDRGSDGPPPGVPAKAMKMLIDPEGGRSMSIVFFETEEDMRKGDEALNAMNPDNADTGRRTSVEMYEVGVDLSV